MPPQFDALQELVNSPGSEIRRLLFVARNTLESPVWANAILGRLPFVDSSPTLFNGLPCISRPILPYLDDKSFQLSEDQSWVKVQLRTIREWRESLARMNSSIPDYNWLLAIPSELLEPDDQLKSRRVDAVPIRYRIEAEARFLNPVFEDIAKKHKGHDATPFTLHVIGVECFYHADVQSAKDLADCFLGFQDAPELHPPDFVNRDRNLCHHIEVETKPLRHELKTRYPEFAEDAFFARIFLTKMAIGMNRVASATVYAKPRKVLKQGDVIFWSVGPSNPALYWCKYGSPKLLEREKRALRTMRGGSPDIQRFLYEIQNVFQLEADYTAVLVSSHQGSFENEPQEFEAWLKDKGTSNDDYVEALTEVDQFLNILHIRPTDAEDSQGPKFLDSTGWIYEKLLTTRRANPSRDIKTPVIQDPDGEYVISDIRPRDAKGEVQIHLEHKETKDLTIVPWACSDWRWRLWKEGIGIDEWRKVTLGLPVNSTRRHTSFLNGPIEKYPEVFRCLGRALDEHIQHDGRIRATWLVKDLFPAWLHGDFHPRNVLLVPSASGHVKTVDGTTWELKIIDLAYARLSCDGNESVPMAFDLVTFEVDMKAESLFDLYSPGDKDFDEKVSLHSLMETEEGIWNWCKKVLPQCSNLEWQTQAYEDKVSPWMVPTESLPDLRIPVFSKVALWRHFSLFRLNAAAIKARQSRDQFAGDNWTPLKSYAQALFFQSIAYLAIRNPNDGKHRKQALSCLAAAEVAARILYGGTATAVL